MLCEHLRAIVRPVSGAAPLGAPEASRCAVYEQRVDGMAITLMDGGGVCRMVGVCGKDSAIEGERILARGIGRGCSLTVIPDTVPAALEVMPGGLEFHNAAPFIRTGAA